MKIKFLDKISLRKVLDKHKSATRQILRHLYSQRGNTKLAVDMDQTNLG